MSLVLLKEQSAKSARSDLVDVLRLARSENVGAVTFHLLMRRFGSAEKALEAIPAMALRGGGRKPITLHSRENAEEEIEKARHFGARMLSIEDAEYPANLKHIDDAPPIITVSGHAHLWQRPCIAMVGARNASANGCHFAKKLALELTEAGYTVVSGLARGIDTFAHQGALPGGTVGVIASGIDHIYPPENAALYKEMRGRGAIITENPFGAIPHHRAFPARNRIIAGMSLGTLVIEAAERSGSLITARYALEQNREVFAVPGSPLDPRSKGCNALIKQGATMVESVDDILKELRKPDIAVFRQQQFDLFEVNESPEPSVDELDEAREILNEKLGVTPVAIDELVAQTQIPANTLLTILLEKELAGVLQRHPGGKVSTAVR